MTLPTTPIDHRYRDFISTSHFAVLTVIVFVVSSGIWIEGQPTLSPYHVVIGFYAASLCGISVASALAATCRVSWAERVCGFAFSLIAWRICYFPIIVLAGTATCYYEFLLTFLGFRNVSLFPVFFTVVATMNGALAMLVCNWYSLDVWSRKLTCVALLFSCLISFSTADDFTLLPDKGFEKLSTQVRIMHPDKNPYREFIVNKNLSLGQKTIAFAGSVLYPIIPQSPWAQGVKGTLEYAFLKNPRGASFERLGDHYGAFVAVYEHLRRSSGSNIIREFPKRSI